MTSPMDNHERCLPAHTFHHQEEEDTSQSSDDSISDTHQDASCAWKMHLQRPSSVDKSDTSLFLRIPSGLSRLRSAQNYLGSPKLQSSFDADGSFEIIRSESPSGGFSPRSRAEYNACIGAKIARVYSGKERDWSCLEMGHKSAEMPESCSDSFMRCAPPTNIALGPGV
jgi:hypothetical protein